MAMIKEDTLRDVFGFITDMQELHPEAGVGITAGGKSLLVVWSIGGKQYTKPFDPNQADFHLHSEKVQLRELLQRFFHDNKER